MALLAATSDEWPAPIVRAARKVRLEMLSRLRSRLETARTEGELPTSTDVDGLSRFYLGVFEGMAIQARDGASRAELRGVVTVAMAAFAVPKVLLVMLPTVTNSPPGTLKVKLVVPVTGTAEVSVAVIVTG